MNSRFQAGRKNMTQGRVLFLLFLLVIPQWTLLAQNAKESISAGKPSLDQLVERVETYWDLLLERKRAKASEYVIVSEREKFLDRTIPRFESPQLKSLAPTADRSEVKVTVIVRRGTNFGIMDWPVTEIWLFKDGNWFNRPNPESLPGLDQKIAKMEDEDAQKATLRKRLRFEQSTLDFGMVKQGTAVALKMKYSLDGDEEVVARIDTSSTDLAVGGLNGFRLPTGKSQELTVTLATRKYEGIVQESIAVRAKMLDAEVEYKIAVQGFVYVPVSVDPKILRFNPDKGVREKEMFVLNNTGSPIVLQSFSSPSGVVDIETLPVTIPPHEKGSLKVKQIQKAARPNTAESLTIAFAQPIENMPSLLVSLLLDASDTRDGVIYDPLRDPNLREQIKKNISIAPKR
jgi:hypothetical protein